MSARELITEHLDLWTGAVTKKSSSGRGNNGKVELTGVKKLRELILELAVRGKLVDQYPNSNPAQGLLEQCREAKQTAIDQGKLKKARKHAPIDSPDMPFNLPNSWSWARLDDLVRVINGRAYKKHEMLTEGAKATPLLRVGNLFTSNDWYYSDLELEEDKYIDSGDLIYAWSASFGPFIWNGGRAIYHYHIWKLDFFDEAAIDKRFLYFYLQAVTEEIKSSGSGIAMIHMTKAKMEELVTPVPPLEEQHRIVQKVDELMALCDRLEQQTSDQLEAHETLVDTLLGTLTQSENATELADNWARLAAHFGTLFTTEQSIDKLKQTILQLAVMGRLVEHCCESETSPSVTDINAPTRFQSNSQNKKKNGGSAVPIGVTEKPFAVPKSWSWQRIGNLIESHREISYGIIKLGKEPQNGGVHTLRCSDVKPRYIDSSSVRRVSKEVESSYQRTRLEGGEVLLNIRGTLGGVALVPFELRGFNIAREVAMLPFSSSVFGPYMVNLIASPFFWEMIESNLKGIAYKGLNLSTLRSLAVPIPPIDEQKSIVQKTDELLGLCDQLKERLNQASETRCQLAEAVVEGALN